MVKTTSKNSPFNVNTIFDELDKYRDFCREYGYRFDEADLFNSKSYIYRQYQKFTSNKPVKSQWEIDLARFKEEEANKRY